MDTIGDSDTEPDSCSDGSDYSFIDTEAEDERKRRRAAKRRCDFLRQAAVSFPKLRFVAFGTSKSVFVEWNVDLAKDSSLWDWWEVIRNPSTGKVVEIREIPVWVGQLVREYLREADVQAVKAFDGT